MINDTALCALAKKLHNIAPDVVIDDPAKVEALLISWFKNNDYDKADDLTDDEDKLYTDWFRRHYGNKK